MPFYDYQSRFLVITFWQPKDFQTPLPYLFELCGTASSVPSTLAGVHTELVLP